MHLLNSLVIGQESKEVRYSEYKMKYVSQSICVIEMRLNLEKQESSIPKFL